MPNKIYQAAETAITWSDAGRSGEALHSLDARSLAAFLHFWIEVRHFASEPEIAISPEGNIQGEWTKEVDDFLVMEFQPTGDVFFSLWQGGNPTEGIKAPDRIQELMNMFAAMNENPLVWSDHRPLHRCLGQPQPLKVTRYAE